MIMKKIPKKYMFFGSYENGSGRARSPAGRELNSLTLKEIACPACGKKCLEQGFNSSGIDSCIGIYYVECNHCEWQCHPNTDCCDCGENIVAFKDWLEAFELMGRPKSLLSEDINLWFYPEGEWREKVREKFKKQNDLYR
jgi:hypothetical protein